MSNMKNGFSTLNRWLGKKNKDKATPNGKLSKSQTNLNLSVSSTNINETSQLEYNRITPLPVVTSNAPFEQTFRITVLLPKDQLYVARLGARVPLSKLLELVCENKQLESEKYEFRNPVDPSQIYSCDLTIGAVGLSEVRLCHKSEAYDNFNADEVIKLHRTSIIRDSLSSSEFSSRNSKHTTKTASPYSSSNSLNSMDSTGMNYARTPVGPPPMMPPSTAPKMMAPPRKKRAAPRPPSQTAIPERSALIITSNNNANNNNIGQETSKTEPNGKILTTNGVAINETMPTRKDFYVSAPNLASSTMLSQSSFSIDCNGNSKTNQNYNDNDSVVAVAEELHNGTQVEQKNARNLYRGSVQNISASLEATTQKFPEPSPRKRILQIKKKAAPAPPPRGSAYFADSFSVHSNTPDTPDTPTTPETSATPETPASPQTPSTPLVASFTKSLSQTALNANPDSDPPKPLARETTLKTSEVATGVPSKELPPPVTKSSANAPKPVPRITTTTIINATPANDNDSAGQASSNVSKVMLNRTPTPEPRSLSTEPPLSDINAEVRSIAEVTSLPEDAHLLNGHINAEDDDNVSKQADSGIGEPVPSPIPDSLPSEGSNIDGKLSTFESSSDDDDMVKVYNFKLGKTLFQPLDEQQAEPEDMSLVHDLEPGSAEHASSKFSTGNTSIVSETASWSFQIPISPPPNFADSTKSTELFEIESSDVPITPNIKERPVLDFAKITADAKKPANSATESTYEAPASKLNATPLPSPQNAPMNGIVNELTAIISEQRMSTIIKKAEETVEIEAAKPNTLSNFSIASIAQQSAKPTESENTNGNPPSSPESATDEEKLYRKRGSLTQSTNILKQRRSITRADSFHTTMQQSTKSTLSYSVANTSEQGLGSRSTSQLSLNKIEQSGLNLQRRRSSSELSIGESPSLQSLEIIKTILNSRKNSLNNSGSDSESKTISGEILNRAEQTAFKLETTSIPKSSPEPLHKDNETFVKLAGPMDKPAKELPKIYRYSGPPSINFSTWSERPKVQVAIKNEGDYIFGGRNASNQNAAVTTAVMDLSNSVPSRNYRASTPTEDFRDFKFRNQKKQQQTEELKKEQSALEVEPSKPLTTTMRMGIPEKEYKIPITVKPLEDFAIESVELRVNNDKTKSVTAPKHAVSTATLNMNGNVAGRQNGRTFETATTRPFTQYGNNTTLPRNGGNSRFSTPAPGPTLLRSTSITQLEANKPKLSTVEIEIAAPFGQNTLRKTGFKEKMLAKEAAEEVKHNNVHNSTETTQTGNAQSAQNSTNYQQLQTTQIMHAPQKSSNKTLQSAKLELKLQKSTSVYVNQASSPVVASTQVMAKTAHIATPITTTPPPPPPPAPAKKTHFNSAVTPTADPRDELLEAIRNFKREELNRS